METVSFCFDPTFPDSRVMFVAVNPVLRVSSIALFGTRQRRPREVAVVFFG